MNTATAMSSPLAMRTASCMMRKIKNIGNKFLPFSLTTRVAICPRR